MDFSKHLETDRLILQPPVHGDLLFIYRLLRNRYTRRFLGGPLSHRCAMARAQSYLSPPEGSGLWMAKARQGKRLGLVYLTPHSDGTDMEVSYQFHPAAWGRGYGQEAVSAVLHQAALPRVIAETQQSNLRSVRLLEALGMHEIDRLLRFGAQQVIYATA
ncbi:ribosomal-protein-alanine N-acetyltransferase [Donghicola tyrosinivorans]|uniref:Ribosomal-protein-alanine N-acetyltransferase n=2 Tax=Donghicola tyrosinivorans TaxID=1652492 RepID=A0A2T0X0K0_9RHOB|nr:GNAT family N-acetyltransferase [Donghicola tyrosinivorans]PRY92479.1 ribosomal-protein-alanine N-acetyltransferase [Donghicola tyrosinivorans]